MFSHLSNKRKEQLNLVLGSWLEEVTEEFNDNFNEASKVKFELLQSNIIEMINVLSTKHNLNKEQYLLSAQILTNGYKNLKDNLKMFEEELEKSESEESLELAREIISSIKEDMYLYEDLIIDMQSIIKKL